MQEACSHAGGMQPCRRHAGGMQACGREYTFVYRAHQWTAAHAIATFVLEQPRLGAGLDQLALASARMHPFMHTHSFIQAYDATQRVRSCGKHSGMFATHAHNKACPCMNSLTHACIRCVRSCVHIMHAYHACISCMHIMHAYHSCIHASMRAAHACMPTFISLMRWNALCLPTARSSRAHGSKSAHDRSTPADRKP